jgi:hypothetical protein
VGIRILKLERALMMGYSADKRKRRREHRVAARELIGAGTFLNARAPVGSTSWEVARWHLAQARGLR